MGKAIDSDTGFQRLCHSVSKNLVFCVRLFGWDSPYMVRLWMEFVTTISITYTFSVLLFLSDTKKRSASRMRAHKYRTIEGLYLGNMFND